MCKTTLIKVKFVLIPCNFPVSLFNLGIERRERGGEEGVRRDRGRGGKERGGKRGEEIGEGGGGKRWERETWEDDGEGKE